MKRLISVFACALLLQTLLPPAHSSARMYDPGYLYFTEYFNTDGIEPQVRSVGYSLDIPSMNGVHPAISHGEGLIAFVNTVNNSVDVQEFSGSPVDSLPLGSISPNYLAWSPNDAFIAMGTSAGLAYLYDVYGLLGEPNNLLGSINLDTEGHELLDIEWDTRTNKLYYSVDTIGIRAISTDGTPSPDVYDTQQKIVQFSLNSDGTRIALLTDNGAISIYTPGDGSSSQVLGPSAARQSIAWPYLRDALAYTEWDGSSSTVNEISLTDGTVSTAYTVYSQTPVFDDVVYMSMFAYTSPARLLQTNVSGSTYYGTSSADFTINATVNSYDLVGKTATITPYFVSGTGQVTALSAVDVSLTTYGQAIHVPITVPLQDGSNEINCYIEVDGDVFLTQDCGSGASITYEAPTPIPVFRMANWKTHERLFITDEYEIEHIAGWNGWILEGVAFYVPSTGVNPVYRMANWKTSERLFITDQNEIDRINGHDGWVLEGVAFYIPIDGSVPVFRMANWKTHERLFITDQNEIDRINGHDGWVLEGVAFYIP